MNCKPLFWSVRKIVFKMLLSSVGEHEGVEIKDGRDDWIRTSDLTHPKRARYQAALRPDRGKTFGALLTDCHLPLRGNCSSMRVEFGRLRCIRHRSTIDPLPCNLTANLCVY
jgi:hypothetical protein